MSGQDTHINQYQEVCRSTDDDPPFRQTHTFDLVLVGHSLGAGTAAILAILLKPEHPTLQCFSYSPPGGLLR